jgi:hypothetical protein
MQFVPHRKYTFRLRYEAQPVNAVWANSRCLLWEPYGTHRYSSYLTEYTLRLHYRDQPVNAVWGNSRCLLWDPYGTHRYSSYLIGDTLRLHYRDQPFNAVWGNIRCFCENHTEHTDTVRTSQKTHYVSITEANRNTQIQSVGRTQRIPPMLKQLTYSSQYDLKV